jgi:hypothetical protein
VWPVCNDQREMTEQGNSVSVGGSSKYAKVCPSLISLSITHLIRHEAFTVPPEFPETLRTLVREILRNQPQNATEIYKFGL